MVETNQALLSSHTGEVFGLYIGLDSTYCRLLVQPHHGMEAFLGGGPRGLRLPRPCLRYTHLVRAKPRGHAVA
jgi:hypothetical protein